MNGRDSSFGGRVRALPAWLALAVVGAAFVAASLWNLQQEVETLGLTLAPFVAATMTLSLSAVVLYAGFAVRASELDAGDAWTVVAGGLGGGAIAVVAQGLTLLVRVAEGRPVAEPQFPLLVLASIGVIGGVVVGEQYVTARRAARQASEARDAMAFTNSLLRHDVLNGVQVIRANVRALTDGSAESPADRTAAIEAKADSLVSLLTDVESITAVLTDDAPLSVLDVDALLDDVVETIRQTNPGATVETDVPDALEVRGTDALVPVFSNLLTNAIKHAGEDVRIRVSATTEGDTVEVRIADDGPGIPPARRDRVFEKGESTADGGEGLYVVDTVLRRLGGDVHVEASEWGGAAFVVALPAPASAEG